MAISTGALSAFAQVVLIDLVLAGDNAIAVGMVASGVAPAQRRRVIVFGLAGAVVLIAGFALITTQLLKIVGLLFAGGLLLLWVCWKMWREMVAQGRAAEEVAEEALEGHPLPAEPKTKTFGQALLQVLLADLAMSLDNVLAVAGAAREHPPVLIAGLLLSVTLMGVAATLIARIIHKHRWIGFVGLAAVLYVALHMMWDGHRVLVIDLGQVERYNALVAPFPITPAEIAVHRHKP